MTGIELMKKVRRHQANVKVILVTGQTDPRIRKDVAEAGADAFFIKPVPMADFLDAVERHLGLVETILPPEPIAAEEPAEQAPRSLPDQLATLRQDLEATVVLLLNDSGRILARAGDLPEVDAEVSLLSSLLSIYSAGQKVARLLGQNTFSNWSVFDGGDYDLIFAPVGDGNAVLAIGKKMADEARVMKSVSILTAGRTLILDAMQGKSTPVATRQAARATPAPAVEAPDTGVKDLEPLLKEAKKKMKPAEVEDFWNKAASEHKAPAKPDMLSYEQARQLGLAPDDKK
jgi:hypothetical protein